MKTSRLRIVLALIIAALFCDVSYSDVIYISADRCAVNYIQQKSSDEFTVSYDIFPDFIDTSNDYYSELFTFNHSGVSKFLTVVQKTDTAYLVLYSLDDLSEPSASRDISLLGINKIDSFAEYGGNIIVAGTKKNSGSSDTEAPAWTFQNMNDDFIIELKPDTLEELREPYYYSPASDYLSYGYIASHKGLIYAVYHLYDDVVGGAQRYRIAVIDISRGLTGLINSGVLLSPFVSCSDDLYVSTTNPSLNFGPINPEYINPETLEERGLTSKMGIYRIDYERLTSDMAAGSRDFRLQDYADRIVTDIADTICPDSCGGFYYFVYDYYAGSGHVDNFYYRRWIAHWDGSKSERIYDSGARNSQEYRQSIDGLCYDKYTKTLFIKIGGIITALLQDSSGQFKTGRQFDSTGSFAVIPVSSGSGEGLEIIDNDNGGKDNSDSPDIVPDVRDKVISEDNSSKPESSDKPVNSSGGGCNTQGAEIFSLVLLAGTFLVSKIR